MQNDSPTPQQKIVAPADGSWMSFVNAAARSLKVPVELVDSYTQLLKSTETGAGCIMVDLISFDRPLWRMLEDLKAARPLYPTVLISEHMDIRTSVTALRTEAAGGVVAELTSTDVLLGIGGALRYSRTEVNRLKRFEALENAIAQLRDRELETLKFMMRGLSSRAIAGEFSVGVRTVENWRQRIMQITECKSTIELAARLAQSPRLAKIFFGDQVV